MSLKSIIVAGLLFLSFSAYAQQTLWPRNNSESFIQSGWRLEEVDHELAANEKISIHYMALHSPATVILVLNSRNETVQRFDLLPEKGHVQIDAGKFAPGVYSYVMLINSRMIVRRKLQISPERMVLTKR